MTVQTKPAIVISETSRERKQQLGGEAMTSLLPTQTTLLTVPTTNNPCQTPEIKTMKFEYKDTFLQKPEAVAALFTMEDNENEHCLCLRTEFSDEFVWLYEGGEIFTNDTSIESQGKAVKYFYPGDSITITF